MSESDGKGRRAADRRRQRQAGDDEDLRRDQTRPGVSVPGGMDPAGEPEHTDRDHAPRRSRTRPRTSVTSVTSVTKVGDAAAEAMQESPLEPTAVKPLVLGPELLAGRLICLEGKDVGKSYELTHDVMVVGRGKEAHVKLTDPGISRAHLEVRYDPATGAYALRSLVTDPAPLLNGEEAAGSDRELADGDVIEIAETTIRFVRMEGEPPLPREVRKPQEATELETPAPEPTIVERTVARFKEVRSNIVVSKRAVAVGLVGLALLTTAGVMGLQVYARQRHQAALNDPAGAYQKLLAGLPALKESRNWSGLMDAAQALKVLAPERDDHIRVARDAADEQLAERNLNLGRMSFTSGQFDAARSVLRLIPDTSVYGPDRDQLLERSSEHGRSAGVAAVKKLMDQGLLREAAERAEHHLVAYPDDQEVRALKASAVRTAAQHEASGSPAWQTARARALAAMDVGDVGGAVAMARAAATGTDTAQASRFARQLEAFRDAWVKGQALLKRADPKAMKPLMEARELERRISGGRSALSKDVARALADAFYLNGIAALASGRDCEARAFFERAQEERPGDGKVVDKLSQITARGRAFLGKAEAARARGNKGEVVRLSREAVCRLPKGDDERTRAERLAGGRN